MSSSAGGVRAPSGAIGAEHAIVITLGYRPARLSSAGMRGPYALPVGIGAKGPPKANGAPHRWPFLKNKPLTS